MRIRCPSCSATYEVADALLDPPRTVRCARCAHDWMAVAVEDPPVPEQPEPSEAEAAPVAREPVAGPGPEHAVALGDTPLSAIERLAAPSDLSPRAIRRRDRLLTAAWAASFAALAALGVAGYTERDVLMRQWPASKRVYATLGLVQVDAKGDPAKSTPEKTAPAPPTR
jgi:predicted Zn finger-like uncharacterized protein